MAKPTQIDELDFAIKAAAESADPMATSLEVAKDFCESNRELIEPYLFEWAVWRVAARMGKYRAKTRRANDRQIVFEGMLGLKSKHLPRQFDIGDGDKIARSEAKIEAFRRLARQLSKLHPPEYEAAMQVVALMAPYTRKAPNITYGEVLKKEAEKKAKREGIVLPLFPEDRVTADAL